jgi:predicted dehydrogenase
MVKAARGDALRLGVIGVGVMGCNHARVLAEMPDVKLVAVADPDDKQADFVQRAFGCPMVADLADLLDLGVDAISSAPPTHLHRELALKAIGRDVSF